MSTVYHLINIYMYESIKMRIQLHWGHFYDDKMQIYEDFERLFQSIGLLLLSFR